MFCGLLYLVQVSTVVVPDVGFKLLAPQAEAQGSEYADCGLLQRAVVYDKIVSQPLISTSVWPFLVCPMCKNWSTSPPLPKNHPTGNYFLCSSKFIVSMGECEFRMLFLWTRAPMCISILVHHTLIEKQLVNFLHWCLIYENDYENFLCFQAFINI